MNTHDTMRKMLPLAAAGVLAPDEVAALEQHLAGCAECQRESQVLRLYSQSLGELPEPALPQGLLQRTIARAMQEKGARAERRREGFVLLFLAAFSWISGAAFWLLMRTATSGLWTPPGFITWSLLTGVSAWATAGAAAVVMRARHELMRRVV